MTIRLPSERRRDNRQELRKRILEYQRFHKQLGDQHLGGHFISPEWNISSEINAIMDTALEELRILED